MRSFLVTVVAALICASAACTSRDVVSADKPQNSARAANANGTVNSTNIGEPPVNAGTPADETNTAAPNAQRRASRMEAIREQAQNSKQPKADLEELLRQSARPASEDSDFAVALTDVIVERRTFHDNPRLLKAEKITRDDMTTFKVYLRDGKVIELRGEGVKFLGTASSAAILQAAGQSVPAPATSKTKGKNIGQ